tara:strand:+ start:2135 stop:2608 length:474 start_codon:yes stop_codon:yes gene_type:complete
MKNEIDNPHNLGPKAKVIQLPSGEWHYQETKTIGSDHADETVFNYTLTRENSFSASGVCRMMFFVENFNRDITWRDDDPYTSEYKIGKKNWYYSRAKALAAIRAHFKSEEWEGNSGKQPAFAISPERDKHGELVLTKKGTPMFRIFIDWDGTRNASN